MLLKKIDELIERKEFRSRSDFVKFAVTIALGQIMLEEARGISKELTLEKVKTEAKEALEKLVAGEFEDEENKVKEVFKGVEEEYKRLKGTNNKVSH